MQVRKAIIPAAGLGTRFLPVTKAQPKEMLPIVDKPTIQYIVEEAVASGIEDIIIVTGRGKRAIEDHFDISYELEETLAKQGKIEILNEVRSISELANIHYIRQKEPKGLGHAISVASRFIGEEPFAVLLGDDIVQSEPSCLAQLIEVYNEYNSSVVGVQEVPYDQVSNYGIISPVQKNSFQNSSVIGIQNLIEKPNREESPSNLAVMGRYILNPSIFTILDDLPPGKNNEVQLTDALKLLNENERVLAYKFTGTRYDVGNKLGFIKANIDFALTRNDLKDELMEYLKVKVEEQ